MKRFWLILSIFFVLLIGLWVAARLTGALQWYVVPTGSSAPNLKIGRHFFASRFKQPKRLDFITYMREMPHDTRKQIYIHRLIGLGGDKVEIRDGLLYVNDIRIDSAINLNQEYLLSTDEYRKIQRLADDVEGQRIDNATYDIFIDEKFIAGNKINAQRVIRPKGVKEDYIYAAFHEDWSIDQFGPVIVPDDCYFVLGDNRHNSLDSRYTGFIPKVDWRGTILRY